MLGGTVPALSPQWLPLTQSPEVELMHIENSLEKRARPGGRAREVALVRHILAVATRIEGNFAHAVHWYDNVPVAELGMRKPCELVTARDRIRLLTMLIEIERGQRG